MSLKCLFGHQWNGCKCERCGEIRDEQHDWNGCKCKRCGKTRDEQHDWDLCKGKCKRCGKTQPKQHDWDGCKCKRCGETRKMPPVIKENISEYLAGDHIAFGKWKGKPLYWIVLSVQADKLLLITSECLEMKPFNLSGEATWENCSLRSELNGDYFYKNPNVFNDNERKSILKTTTDSPGVYYQNQRTWEELYTKGGNDTQNYVFLLNIGEACVNFVTSEGWMIDGMGNNTFKFPKGESLSAEKPWWLRNSTRKGRAAVVVTSDGMINYNGFTVSESTIVYIRPAMWISK